MASLVNNVAKVRLLTILGRLGRTISEKAFSFEWQKLIVENVEFAVGHAYTKADYNEHVLQSPARSTANEPIGEEYYTFAVQKCGGSLAEWRAAKSRMVPLKFVFDTASKREKREIVEVFFGAANDRAQHMNGVEQWFNPAEGVAYESRKEVHQLLTADTCSLGL